MSPPTPLLSRRDMALWARYLRTVHVQYCPFTHGATPAAWLAMITTKKVKQASPKLAITKELLPQRKAGAAPTFASRNPLLVSSILCIGTIGVGAIFIVVAEKQDLIHGVYWAVVTMSTVGYGSGHPVTDGGRVFAAFYMLVGVSCMANFVGELAERPLTPRTLVSRLEHENDKLRTAKKRELNERIRALVAFVKKRDKRVIAHLEAQEAAKVEKAAKLAEERKAKQAAYDAERKRVNAEIAESHRTDEQVQDRVRQPSFRPWPPALGLGLIIAQRHGSSPNLGFCGILSWGEAGVVLARSCIQHFAQFVMILI